MSETVKKTDQSKPVGSKAPRHSSTALLVILCLLLAVVAIVLSYMLKNHVAAKSGTHEQLRLSAIAGFDCETIRCNVCVSPFSVCINIVSPNVADALYEARTRSN